MNGGTAGGNTTYYTYDALNRLTSLTNSASQTISFTYDSISRRTKTTFPNGVTTDYSYDAKSQLTSLINKVGSTNISTFGYSYDGVGDRTSMSTTRTGITVNSPLSYSYDNLYRLTQVTNPVPAQSLETFVYDAVGNRLRKTGQTTNSTYDNANRLIEDAEFTYVYDNNGNLIQKTSKSTSEVTQYTYDTENKLIQVSKPGTTATYRYDGLGRRVEKNVNGVITRYIYDGEDILLEYNGSNALTAKYTHGAGIDEPLIMERGGVSHFYNTDGLGSITDLSNSAGGVAQSYVYNSFGQIVSQSGSVANPYAYTGREFDSESGLYYYRARYYEAMIGRFLQEDPFPGFLDFPETLNQYLYVTNNPINFVDPNGEFLVGALPLLCVGGGCEAAITALGGILSGAAAIVVADFINDVIIAPLCAKGGKQNVRDTGLERFSDEEISKNARDKGLSPKDRRRFQKEEKARKKRRSTQNR